MVYMRMVMQHKDVCRVDDPYIGLVHVKHAAIKKKGDMRNLAAAHAAIQRYVLITTVLGKGQGREAL
jgi:hypothetical protein